MNYSVPEAELRAVFARFGTVQTCIVNKDKRHAFVKMLTRKDAENAKTNMEGNRNSELPLRVSNPMEGDHSHTRLNTDVTFATDTVGSWLWAS